MSIESSAPSGIPPQTETTTIEAWLAGRYFEGRGFDELAQALAKRLSIIANSLEEKRPLYFITKQTDEEDSLPSSLKALVTEVVESLAIPLNPALTSYLGERDFDLKTAQKIIDDRRRPLIQPLAIGSGEQPGWWLGPLWIFPSPGPVDVFRRQLSDIQP